MSVTVTAYRDPAGVGVDRDLYRTRFICRVPDGLLLFRLYGGIPQGWSAVMGSAEIAEYVGYLFGAYASGWGSGYLIYAFRRLVDFI